MNDQPEVQEPPHSVEDESYVLGACYIWPDDYLKSCREVIGQADPWYIAHHRSIWGAICKLKDDGEPIDHTSIVRALGTDPWIPELLDRLGRETVTGAGADGHARIVLKLAAQRRFLVAAQNLAHTARTGEVNGQWDELKAARDEMESAGGDYKPPTEVQTALELITSPIKPILYALKPIIALGKLTQIQGEPKAGKSVFAFYMAMSMALGYWLAGRFSLERKHSVLYLADEDAENLLQLRLHLFFKGMGGIGNQDDLLNLAVITQEKCAEFDFDLTEERGRTGLVNLIKYTGAEVVFLDSLSNFCPVSEENSKKEMQPIMRFLKRTAIKLGVAIVYIHHIAKPQSGLIRSRVSKGRGSSTIAAAWDIMLDWGDRGDSNTTPVSIMSKLANTDGKFDVIWVSDLPGENATEVKWSLQDSLPTENARENMKKIIAALKTLCATPPHKVKSKTVAIAAGMSDDNTVVYLEMAMNLDQVARERSDERGKPWLYSPVEA